MASLSETYPGSIDRIVQSINHRESPESNDTDNIPYHARKNAKPFTYGNIPAGLKTCDNNNVHENEDLKTVNLKHVQSLHPSNPSTIRKTSRPSISPSSPVLRKTPSRQEFEEMLMERKEQASREQNIYAIKLAQKALIQRDWDDLHEKLQKSINSTQTYDDGVFGKSSSKLAPVKCINLSDDCPVESNFPSLTPNLVDQNEEDMPIISTELNKDQSCTSPDLSTVNPLLCEEQSLQAGDLDINNQAQHMVYSAKASSEFWYKPDISREEAVELLRDCNPGTFLIRNSATYRDAFGLVLRVVKTPEGISSAGRLGDELVRHFLLEPTNRGIRLKGCSNEPTFSSLSAFVYQHSNNNLALPCTLIIPNRDLIKPNRDEALTAQQMQALSLGAAFNVLYLYQCELETLTGDEAVLKAIKEMLSQNIDTFPLQVQLNISIEGVTLTDNSRKTFFRRHYGTPNISHFCIDPNRRLWSVIANAEGTQRTKKTIFAFVAQSLFGKKDNQCHIFCDLSSSQPASAIIEIAHKIMPQTKSC